MDHVSEFRKRLNPNGRTATKGHHCPLAPQQIYDALPKILFGEFGLAIQELSLRRVRAMRPVVQDSVWQDLVVQILADYIQMEDAVITRNRAERLAQSAVTPPMLNWLREQRDALIALRVLTS